MCVFAAVLLCCCELPVSAATRCERLQVASHSNDILLANKLKISTECTHSGVCRALVGAIRTLSHSHTGRMNCRKQATPSESLSVKRFSLISAGGLSRSSLLSHRFISRLSPPRCHVRLENTENPRPSHEPTPRDLFKRTWTLAKC